MLGFKKGFGGVGVKKKDPPLETRRGKCNRVLKEPKQAPAETKMALEYMLRLT